MNGEQDDADHPTAPTATVHFAGAGERDRLVAGLPAAARHVRALEQAGFAEAWLVCPGAAVPAPLTEIEVDRLRGAMTVHFGAPAMSAGLVIAGRELHPAEDLRAAHVAGLNGSALMLDGPSASAALLSGSGKDSDGIVSRWVNRRISRRISALLLRLPAIRPIHGTVGTAVLALAMFVVLLFGGAKGAIAGGLLFQAASIFDGVDGEIARVTHRSSAAGAVIDSAVDMAANILFVLGMTVNLWLRDGAAIGLVGAWGLALFAVGLAVIFLRSRGGREAPGFDLLKERYRSRYREGFIPLVVRFATAVTSRDFFALLFMVMILVGLEHGVLWVFAGAATVWILLVLALPNRGAARRLPEGSISPA
jgi:CDP-L-myo-inositol myo-inositolphosphotransferase